MIKGSEYVASRIPPAGAYTDLLHTAGEVIEANAFREFTESFSCDNIRSLVVPAGAGFRRRIPAPLRRGVPLGQRAGAF